MEKWKKKEKNINTQQVLVIVLDSQQPERKFLKKKTFFHVREDEVGQKVESSIFFALRSPPSHSVSECRAVSCGSKTISNENPRKKTTFNSFTPRNSHWVLNNLRLRMDLEPEITNTFRASISATLVDQQLVNRSIETCIFSLSLFNISTMYILLRYNSHPTGVG